MEIVIDAAQKSLGRIASEAAKFLIGKNRPDYIPSRPPSVKVKIINAKKLALSQRKLKWKIYRRYTGYPGGLKSETMESLWRRRPAEVVRRAVYGMLPKNKLRKRRITRLSVAL